MILRGALAALALSAMVTQTAMGAELHREGTIALPDTSGRIDHMAVDLTRKRLFVAELGNGSVDVIDLAGGKVIYRIAKLNEPQALPMSLGPIVWLLPAAGTGPSGSTRGRAMRRSVF